MDKKDLVRQQYCPSCNGLNTWIARFCEHCPDMPLKNIYDEAWEYMHSIRRGRTEHAKKLLQLRRIWHEDCNAPFPISKQDYLMKPVYLLRAHHAPTVRRACHAQYAYSQTSWVNHLDTEYYSACGYDDSQYEARQHAQDHAVLLYVLWKHLKGLIKL